MLSNVIVKDIVRRLNEQTDIPFVNEAMEGDALLWLVERVNSAVPNWVLQFMVSAADGLTEEELKVHEDVIVAEINRIVDLPGTPEFIEEKLIRFVTHAILEYARLGFMAPEGA